jgi:membrane associated rhomboid family serine protease
MSTTFFKKLKNPSLSVLFIFLAWISVFVLSVIAKVIFGDASDSLMNYNPLVNGFIHGDPSHLMMNLALMFVFLIPDINQKYDFQKIFFITLIISVIYFPLALVIGMPAVGVSGTLYFMLSRACLNRKNILLYIFFAIMILPELISFANVSDGTAHMVHIIGATLGFLSLKAEKYNFLPAKVIEYVG